MTTASGLKYAELQQGDGATVQKGSQVSVHYTGWLLDGTRFDSSYDRGEPFDLVVGAGQVIKGWDEGLQGMKVGGIRQLVIPANLAYGERGAGGVIPPNATLVFEVEIVAVR
ncbi:MAG TPA: FKBP-type peptidyl-prolyl cis-trans isomerase [Anaerolineales bacterium]|nr:FKBP-type peptidyl-prolyl cis-trans isomerase [Anaerolineales bacterium]